MRMSFCFKGGAAGSIMGDIVVFVEVVIEGNCD